MSDVGLFTETSIRAPGARFGKIRLRSLWTLVACCVLSPWHSVYGATKRLAFREDPSCPIVASTIGMSGNCSGLIAVADCDDGCKVPSCVGSCKWRTTRGEFRDVPFAASWVPIGADVVALMCSGVKEIPEENVANMLCNGYPKEVSYNAAHIIFQDGGYGIMKDKITLLEYLTFVRRIRTLGSTDYVVERGRSLNKSSENVHERLAAAGLFRDDEDPNYWAVVIAETLNWHFIEREGVVENYQGRKVGRGPEQDRIGPIDLNGWNR